MRGILLSRSPRDRVLTKSPTTDELETTTLQWAAALLARAEAEGRYGQLTFYFERGKITGAREEATYKPPAAGRLVSETR